MKIVTTYVAFDDKDFDSEETCLAYEQHYINLMIELSKCYTMYDKTMRPLPVLYTYNMEEMIKEFEYAYEECTYIIMKEIPSKESIDFIWNYYGYELPNGKKGMYHYNFSRGRWEKV